MSSELDFSFEDFLNEDFDSTGFANYYCPEPLETGIQPADGGDLVTQDVPTAGFPQDFSDEAPDQLNALHYTASSAPSEADAGIEEGPVLTLQERGFDDNPPYSDPTDPKLKSMLNTWRCPWSACKSWQTLVTAETREAHRREHMIDIISHWTGVGKCLWPECSSKATFKTPALLKTHLFNIHVTPLVCTYPQCSYTRPFGKQYELDRHFSTAHGKTRGHKCPIDTCEASMIGFPRKDKLVKHLREDHENVRCPYNHCFALVVVTQEEQHVSMFHGGYECTIGGCDNGSASCFSWERLGNHLRVAHGIDYDGVNFILIQTQATADHVARSYFKQSRKPAQDCVACSSLQCIGNSIRSI